MQQTSKTSATDILREKIIIEKIINKYKKNSVNLLGMHNFLFVSYDQ